MARLCSWARSSVAAAVSRLAAALAAYASRRPRSSSRSASAFGVGLLRHAQGAADGVQPDQVGVHRLRLGGDGSERRDVGYGEARGRRDLGDAPRGQVTQRGAAGLELGAQGAGPRLVVGVGATVGRAHDEVALGAGDVVLQRADQPADTGAPASPGRHVGDPGVELVQLGCARPRASTPARGPRCRGPAPPRRGAGAGGRWCRPPTGRPPAARAATRPARRRADRPRAARPRARPSGTVRGRLSAGVQPAPDERGEALQLGGCRPDPSPRSPPAGRSGRRPPSTGPSRAACRW